MKEITPVDYVLLAYNMHFNMGICWGFIIKRPVVCLSEISTSALKRWAKLSPTEEKTAEQLTSISSVISIHRELSLTRCQVHQPKSTVRQRLYPWQPLSMRDTGSFSKAHSTEYGRGHSKELLFLISAMLLAWLQRWSDTDLVFLIPLLLFSSAAPSCSDWRREGCGKTSST